MSQSEIDRIANRYVGKILRRMGEVMEVPDIVADDIKKQLHYMKADLVNEIRKGSTNDGEPFK